MTQIVSVSRGSLSRGREFAECLARKLDYALLSREDLIEAAIGEGIQVSKLETSMMNPRAFTERLALERDHYLAFSTAYLCAKALEGPLVYHGRTGHLLLRNIGHVLRVRVVADEESRIKTTMARLGVSREAAHRYLTDVEEDRRTWVRSMYHASWEDASQYDAVVNVERMSVENAASALIGMTQLPEFQMTPASRRAMEDLRLGARARMRLARDPRTAPYGFAVGARNGVVTVTYQPHDLAVAEHLHPVLEGLEGLAELHATMAATTILWVQEAFDHTSETFREVVEIAGKWSAAVELVRFVPGEAADAAAAAGALAPSVPPRAEAGIEDDVEEEATDEGGLKATLDELARLGKSAGGRQVHGERGSLVASCCGAVSHSLVVVGNLFLAKDPAAKLRLTREIQDSLASRMRVPVVTADELRRRYLFGRRDVLRLVGFLAVVVALYTLILTHQEPVLTFLFGRWSGGGLRTRIVVAATVFAFVPLVAYCYGAVARSLMKLIKME
jgi:cytidylate kinase